MDYENMTTVELKKAALEAIRKNESPFFLLGWLEQSWVSVLNEEADRAVCFATLKKYGG